MALGPGVAIAAGILDAQVISRGDEYAGLGGLLIGLLAGGALNLAALVTGIAFVKRRENRRKLGLGLGLIIGGGLQPLGVGLCFAAGS